MLEPQVVIFHEDDIDRIIHECLTHPYCKIMVAVKASKIKNTALNFLDHINPTTLARQLRLHDCYARADFTNGAELLIIGNNTSSRGHKASKIYCSPDTTIEVYFCVFIPEIFDYKYILQNIKAEEAEKKKMIQWHEYSYLAETCGNTHCKYFAINGCTHPYVKDCKNASLYWPWQLDYDNMEILIKKRNEINGNK